MSRILNLFNVTRRSGEEIDALLPISENKVTVNLYNLLKELENKSAFPKQRSIEKSILKYKTIKNRSIYGADIACGDFTSDGGKSWEQYRKYGKDFLYHIWCVEFRIGKTLVGEYYPSDDECVIYELPIDELRAFARICNRFRHA